MSDRLCVVMPVYNEEEAIGGVLKKWSDALVALGIDFTIRPYNDGSKDSSLRVMRDFVAANPNARIEVKDKPNGGHGNTILTGYREAAADGFDWIFQIDSDDEIGPEKFNEIWSRRRGYDFLVGIRDGRVQALPRKIISFVSRCCVKLFYGRKTIWDVNTPYRLMRVSVFASIYNQIPLTTFAPNVIVSGMVAQQGFHYYETRIPQHDRTTGEVSIKKWKLLKAAAKSFRQTICFSLSQTHGKFVCLAFAAALLFAGAAFSIGTNPFGRFPTCDSSVFLHIGKGMLNGLTPYRDMFDHKGILLYFMQVMGLSLGGGSMTGVWLLELVLHAISLVLVYKMLRLKVAPLVSLFTVICYIGLLFRLLNGGNMAESYGHFFIVLAMWASASYMTRGGTGLHFYAMGLSIAALAFLKPTFMAVGILVGVSLAVAVFGSGGRLKPFACLFAGAMTIVGPLAWYLQTHSLWADFWNAYIVFNIKYGGAWDAYAFLKRLPGIAMLLRLDRAAKIWILVWGMNIGVIVSGFSYLFICKRDSVQARRLWIGCFLFAAITYASLAASGYLYWYYAIALPAVVYPIAFGIRKLLSMRVRYVLAGVLLSVIVLDLVVHLRMVNFTYLDEAASIEKLKGVLRGNMDTVVLGNRAIVYDLAGVHTASRYFYNAPINLFDPAVDQYLKEYLFKNRCQVVIPNVFARETSLTNGYGVVYKNSHYMLLLPHGN